MTTHKVEWRACYVEDWRTGKRRLAAVFPHRVPCTSWRDRFRDFGDVALLAAVVVLVVLSAVAR